MGMRRDHMRPRRAQAAFPGSCFAHTRGPLAFLGLTSLLFAFALFFPLLLTRPATAGEVAPTVIILDGSGSMWGVVGGQRKLAMVRQSVSTAVGQLPASRQVGLMAYGHRRKGDCADIEMLVPPEPSSGPAVREAVQSMHFLGMTPLATALRKAAEALRSNEAPATIVLVTDGAETCDGDPCAVASELKKAGAAFTAHVVGLGLTREDSEKVACIAKNTGGIYQEAWDSASLDKALRETLTAAPQ